MAGGEPVATRETPTLEEKPATPTGRKGPRLSTTQADFLFLLERRVPRSLDRAATLLGISRSSAYAVSVRLRRRGWIARDEDGWYLTTEGEAALPRVREWHTAHAEREKSPRVASSSQTQ